MTSAAARAVHESASPGDHALAALAGIPGVRLARDLAPVKPAATVDDEILPVRSEIAQFLPAHGLRRGTVAAVHGSTLLWLLLSEAVRAGSWTAIVGLPDLDILAGLDLGVPSERLVLIPQPGPELATVLSALLDAVDLIVVNAATIRPALARTVASRARQRRRIVLPIGTWPGPDLNIRTTGITWSGLDHGAGRLTVQSLGVRVEGRGVAARGTSGLVRLDWTTPSTRATPAIDVVDDTGARQTATA